MSRFGPPRGYENDLAYGDAPRRWDRDRFERFGRGPASPPGFHEDYRYQDRDGPGRRDVAVADRVDAYSPRGRYEERDRFYEQDRLAPGGPRRRTDRELFGDMDPREYANMQMMPYRAKSSTRRDEGRDIDIDIDIDQRRGDTRRHIDIDIDQHRGAPQPPRPGLLRRQSSLDTFDRRGPPRRGYEDQSDYRMPAYTPVPLPIRKEQRFGDDYYRNYEPEDYREVEIQRERSVHRRRPKSHRSVSQSHHRDRSSHWGGTTPRASSPARTSHTSRSRRPSSPGPEFYERKTVVEERNPPPPPPAPVYYEDDRRTQFVEERQPMNNAGALVVQEREYRTDRDINSDIAKLEAERRALRLEREADERRDMALRVRERGDEEYQVVEYRDSPREVLRIEEREREKSPQRNVLRVEKDRKGRMAMVRSKH